MQSIFDFEKGDCMRACVASLFELPLEKVPNFWDDVELSATPEKQSWQWTESMRNWSIQYGIVPLTFRYNKKSDLAKILKDVYVIASGESPRNKNSDHAVIMLNGQIIHDPHPEQTGILGGFQEITVFVVQNWENIAFINI